MIDKIETLRHSLIQHGTLSNRVYLMRLDPRDVPQIVKDLDQLAVQMGYTKIFLKVPEESIEIFDGNGYVREAVIPRFFNGQKNCVFIGKYLSELRRKIVCRREIEKIINLSIKKSSSPELGSIKMSYSVQKAIPADADEMSRFYKRVFASYPFPVTDAQYLRETMMSHIHYYLVRDATKIIAMASSEVDSESQNVEMTDFATLPEHCGKNLAGCLLKHMEGEMRAQGVKTAYTIARALSHGMNITFAKNNYTFAGTLINNTHISGGIESMNVWYKYLKIPKEAEA